MKTKKAPQKSKKNITIGLDLGDRQHSYCVLGESAEIIKEGSVGNTRERLEELAIVYPGARVIMEAGTHSPWVSRHLSSLGLEVVVGNPRKTRAIYQNERKSDRKDAEMLSRIGRMDPQLLHPIEHGSEQAQHDMMAIKMRDALVRARVGLINSVRFTLKSLGYKVSNPSSKSFHKRVLCEVPQECHSAIAPTLSVLEELTQQIDELARSLTELVSKRYPEALQLQQVAGVGPITSLYFVLKVGDPSRFPRSRDIGAYVGLTPRRDQSGARDKQLRITKCGDTYLRRLLVSAAQYILGPFGTPSSLREQGLKLAKEGSAKAKKRAVVAVARKLAVLLLSLWKSRVAYAPFPAMA